MESSKVAEENAFTLSPALTAPCTYSTEQEPDNAIFDNELFANNLKEKELAPTQTCQNVRPSLHNSEEEDDPKEPRSLFNSPRENAHQAATTLSAGGLPTRSLQQEVLRNTGVPLNSLSTLCRNENSMDIPISVHEALFPPVSPTGCVVTIHNLPSDISMRDVLARISGGEVRTATLLEIKNAMCGVITFKEVRSAQLFVHASKSFNEIWTFCDLKEDSGFMKAQIAYAPTLDASKLFNDPANIPMEPRVSMEVDLATRCLAITNCSFELIEEIWTTLGLYESLRYPHYTNRFEDIWLDSFQRGRSGRFESATLHIWYTNTNMALGAKKRSEGRHWSRNLRFEADPCDDTPAVLFFRPSDDIGFAWHSNPKHSLLDVYRAGSISVLFQAWREIGGIVKNAGIAPTQFEKDLALLPSEDISARRKAARANGGFDPVTLMSTSSQDYDSDDEGGRANPRINTRKIEAHQAATRRVVLPSPTAYLTILENLAATALSTYDYSPGTYSAMSAVGVALDSEGECSDGVLGGFAAVDIGNSSATSPDDRSREAGDAENHNWSEPQTTRASSEEKPASLRKAFQEPTHWYTVSLAEFLACNEGQQKAMGTVFYVPPEGHSSLRKYSWIKDLPSF